MKPKTHFLPMVFLVMACWGVVLLLPSAGAAHCDTLAGSVVQDARLALQSGDVTPVLKWVGPPSKRPWRLKPPLRP
jgi:hypothetical protein